jgi:hypothetical protein
MRPLMIFTAAAVVAAGPLFAQTGPAERAPAAPASAAAAPATVPAPAADASVGAPVASTPAAAVAIDPWTAEAQALAREYGMTLKGELEAAVKSGGPVKAIVVCKERAPAIAADLSTRAGWDITRVSLKVRNPQMGAPDAWEEEVLTRFEARKAAGNPADTLAVAEVVEQGGQKQFRYMKAIPTAEVCLVCHGADLTPEVTAALDQAYPRDRARGYALGDIRGAFSLTRPLD